MKTMEQFYSEVMADKELEEAVSKAHKENRFTEFLNEHGVDGTAEAFEALVKEKKNGSRELSDEDIEQVTGGELDWRQDYYIRKHNVQGMSMYLRGLASSGTKLYEPDTKTTFTITDVSTESNNRYFELRDVDGKKRTRTHNAYTLYCKIKKHQYLLPWEK